MMVCAVIPAYNEEKKIVEVVRAVLKYVDSVVVVDDCSVDRTAVVAKEAGATVLIHVVNRGQGAALRTGTHWALLNGADVVVHFDADGQFRPEDIAKGIKPITDDKYDVVFGSRFLDDSTKMPNSKRYFIMPLARFINKLFYNIELTDPQSGFRILSAKTARQLHWHQDRMAHCSEILSLVNRHHLRVLEIPITVKYDEYGQSVFGGFKIIFDLLIKKFLH